MELGNRASNKGLEFLHSRNCRRKFSFCLFKSLTRILLFIKEVAEVESNMSLITNNNTRTYPRHTYLSIQLLSRRIITDMEFRAGILEDPAHLPPNAGHNCQDLQVEHIDMRVNQLY